MADRQALAHLLRRATFGPRAEEVDAAERVGLDATVAALVKPVGSDAGAARTPVPKLGADPYLALGKNPGLDAKAKAQEQRRQQIQTVTAWWLTRMIAADHQLHEKLTFFWHGHWATSVEKVKSGPVMLAQQQTLFRTALGDFGAQVRAMLRDPALIFWLDGQKNTKKAPNENLARELMELFTLGIGHYQEQDVQEGARALTGWQLKLDEGTATFAPARHDAGSKTILGQSGAFDGDGFATVLLAQPAGAEFVAGRLWFRFGSGEPMPDAVKRRMVAAGRTTADVLTALFTAPEFGATRGQLVKQPVEWFVGAARQLDIRPEALPENQRKQLLGVLNGLGQVPLRPPSVGGWPAGPAWLTTSATQERLRGAELLAARTHAAVLEKLNAVPAGQRVDALARLLVVDAFTERTRDVLQASAKEPRKLIALGLASPEYAVH